MNIGKEFISFAKKGRNISGSNLHRFSNSVTPYIIEERTSNVTELDIFSRLMSDRLIFLGTEIYDEVSNILQAQMLFLESLNPEEDIRLYVNSPGGDVYAGLGIYDTMQYIKPDVSTMCVGLAASMGAILLTAGTKGKRFALPHSRIMIHQPMGGIGGQASDITITSNEINNLKKDLYDILVTHTGQTYKKIEKDGDRDFWMKAEEAKNYGLIDNVLRRDKK